MSVFGRKNDGSDDDGGTERGENGRDIVPDERPDVMCYQYTDTHGQDWFGIYSVEEPGDGIIIDGGSTIEVRQ